MKRIADCCAMDKERFPGELLALEVCERESIPRRPEITEAYKRIKARHHFGSQYEWLARFAEDRNLFDLELPAERGSHILSLIEPHLEKTLSHGLANMALRSDAPAEFALLRYFLFPVAHLTKSEINYAALKSFPDLMPLTWSCHTPIAGPWPCGTCGPCDLLMKSKLYKRVGWRGFALYFINRVGLVGSLRRIKRRCVTTWRRATRHLPRSFL